MRPDPPRTLGERGERAPPVLWGTAGDGATRGRNAIRILYANDGSSAYDAFFLSRLSKGHEVTLLSFLMRPDLAPTLPDGVKLIAYPALTFLRRLPILGAPAVTCVPHAVLLKRAIGRLRPEIVIANEATSYGFYAALANVKGYALFVWGSDVLIAPDASIFLRMMVKLALRRARTVLVDSAVQRDACLRLGAASEKILTVPWYDCNETLETKISADERERAKGALGFLKSDKVVVSSRWHRKPYSVETLIKAMPLVVERRPDVKFLVMGSGPDTGVFKKLANELGVRGSVVFTGMLSRSAVLRNTQVADVYVSTSLSDGTSASLLDAMALEIPAVVTDIPANREWIADGSSGLFFVPRNHGELAEKIIAVLGDSALARRLASNAKTTVQSRADWKKNSIVLFDALEDTSNRNGGREETWRSADESSETAKALAKGIEP